MTDFSCAGGGRFQGAASFPWEAREGGMGQGKKIRAASLGGQSIPGEPASLAELLTSRTQRDGRGLLASGAACEQDAMGQDKDQLTKRRQA